MENLSFSDHFDKWCLEKTGIGDVNNNDMLELDITIESFKYDYLYAAWENGYKTALSLIGGQDTQCPICKFPYFFNYKSGEYEKQCGCSLI